MRRGLSLTEVLIVASILATLAALLFPVYLRVRSRMYEVSCANQFRQIGIAIHMYCNDYGDGSPYYMRFAAALYPHYIRDRDLLICPRVRALTPSHILERFRQKDAWGYERSTYWLVSPRGLDDSKRRFGNPIGFSDVFARRGDNTPIGYCEAHRRCDESIGDILYEIYGEYGWKICNDIFINPGPFIVLRWGGKVDFVYKGSVIPPNTDEFLVDY